MYKDLEPLQTYTQQQQIFTQPKFSQYSSFEAPKHKLCHIIWNLFLIDKDLKDLPEIIEENNIKYIIGIFPNKNIYGQTFPPGISHHVMLYDEHTPAVDIRAFDEQCQKIEEHRQKRNNIFICCNSGYQRSIPFLCYYLVKYHPEEVPTIAKAVELVLSQVDKKNYASMKDEYTFSTELVLPRHLFYKPITQYNLQTRA
jgi:hypothetical protein